MADNEIPEEGLTNEPESVSINDIITRAIEAAGNDAPAEVEDGPADDESAGELPNETEPAADSDEPQADEPVAADTQPASPDEEEAKPEVESLRDLALTSQESVNKLLEIHAKDLAERQKPKVAEVPRVSEEALHLALHGRPEDEEAWKALPANVRAAATKAAREHLARETRAALDPKARYQEIRQAVLDDLASLVQPLVEDLHRRKAEDVYREIAGSVEPGDKKRLAEIYQAVPGAKSTIEQQREALKLATLKLEVEKQTAALAKDRQKIDAKKRDRAAVDAAKNKGTNAGRRVPAGGNQTRERPKLKSPADVFGDEFQQYIMGG